jgi:hypothetical protein
MTLLIIMDFSEQSEALPAMPKRKRKQPEKPEKPKKPKVEEIPDLLAKWPSPSKVIFEPLQMKGRLSPQPLLPPDVGIEPYELFRLFIPESLYAIILKHTNFYAGLYQAGEDGSHTWKPTTPGDIKTFFAAIFYMGAWGRLLINAFWRPSEAIFKWLQENIS